MPAIAVAAVAVAACLSALPLGTVGDRHAPDGALALAAPPQAADAAGHAAHPWASTIMPSAHAAGGGDAYIITDLGNMFQLDIEQPPGLNWTQILLDRIRDAEERSRESIDDLRDESRGTASDLRDEARDAEDRVTRIINQYIQNNTLLLAERARQFEQFRSVTNMSIADMIDRDTALNSSINQLVQNIRQETHSTVYQTILDKEAAVSAISSQVHYVYYDNPSLIMECVGTSCDTKEIEPFMRIRPGSNYVVYNDPGWLLPSVYAISPVHYGAKYTADDTLEVSTIPGNHLRLYNTFISFVIMDHNNRVLRESGPNDKDLNVLTWGCYASGVNQCSAEDKTDIPRLNFENRAIHTPVGYPYHVNMISKDTSPHIPPGLEFTTGVEALRDNNHCSRGCTLTSVAAQNLRTEFGLPRAPFNYNFRAAGADEVRYHANELIDAGIGNRGAMAGYFSADDAKPSMPVSETTRTWPNCAGLPSCTPISFAFDNFVPRGSPLNEGLATYTYHNHTVPDSWLVFMSPQLHITTWGPHNTLKGVHAASPQFVDRMNKRIIVPTFQAEVPASESGRLYDVRGYARIPFAPESPMNVSHVSLRPTSALLDTERIGREYMYDAANRAGDLYNIRGYEFEKLGLINCEAESYYVTCDKRGTDPHTLDIVWSPCRLLGAGDSGCTSLSEIGEIVAGRADFAPESNARLSQLEGVYSDALYVPLVHGYSGFRLVIDGVAVFTEYKDIRSNDYIFLSPPKSANVGKISSTPIHYAEASVTTTSQAVAPRDGDMSILAVVSATGTLDIRNEYRIRTPPPPVRTFDPLDVVINITKNGEHYATKNIGINEHPNTVSTNSQERVNGVDVAVRRVVYDYPSFVFAGTTTVPVSAGDHVLFELIAKIDGTIDEWSPRNVISTRGISSAQVGIDAASIMMGVG